ncbi:hypothetical protein Emag_001876 [Eimeria magna]
MKPQASIDDLELDGARCPMISQLKYVEEQPVSFQDVARPRGGTGSAPLVCGSWWKWDHEEIPACDEGLSMRSGRSVEVALPASDRRFSGITLHKAAGALGGLGSVKSKVFPSKQQTSTAKSLDVHEEPRHSKVVADLQVDALPQPSEKRTGFCLGGVVSKFAADFAAKEAEQAAQASLDSYAKTTREGIQRASAMLWNLGMHALVIRCTTFMELEPQSKGSRESLSLFPLKFTDKSMEAEFAFNQERGARFRNVLGGFIASFLVYVDLAVSAAVWHTGVFMHDTEIFSSYMTFLACCTIFCAAYALSYRIPWVKNYLEYTSYFIATSAVVSQTCLSIWWKSALYSENNYYKFLPALSRVFGLDASDRPARGDSVVYHIVVVYNELFLGIFLQSTLLCVFLLFDVLTPTRFYIATRLQIFNTAVGIIPFVYGAFQLPETFVANIASIVCIITISAAGMVGAYPMEVRRRGLFYEWLKAAGSSSALDDIRSNCREVGSILTALQKGAGELDVSAGISQALTLTQECLFIFSTCKNLYLTNVNEDLKDEAALLLPVVGVDIGFNPLEFERTYGDGTTSILLDAGTALLSRVASDWGCEEGVLRNFLVKIDELYQEQPYHNAKHGTLVAHTMSLLCRSLGIFREMNALGVGTCLVAGLCHDVGHPGRNNNFFTSEMSPLEAREVRSKIIDLILATDMRTHFEFLSRFRTIRGSDQFNHIKNEDDRWLAAELCIRASDIGHGALSWSQHFEWTGLATTEFYLQGDEELRLGRTISPLCDRQSHSQLAKSQIGFLQHVVRPLFVELDSIGKQQKTMPSCRENGEVISQKGPNATAPRGRDLGVPDNLNIDARGSNADTSTNNGDAAAAGGVNRLPTDVLAKTDKTLASWNVSDSQVSPTQVPSSGGDNRELASGDVEGHPAAGDKASRESQLLPGAMNLPTPSENLVDGSGKAEKISLAIETPPGGGVSHPAPHRAIADAVVQSSAAIKLDSRTREQAAAESPPPSSRSNKSTDSARGVPVPALDKTFFGF